MPKRQSGNKKGKQSNFAKLSIFQPNKYKFKKTCPLSVKGAPKIDYKNRRFELMEEYLLTGSVENDKNALMDVYHMVQGRNKTFLKPEKD